MIDSSAVFIASNVVMFVAVLLANRETLRQRRRAKTDAKRREKYLVHFARVARMHALVESEYSKRITVLSYRIGQLERQIKKERGLD